MKTGGAGISALVPVKRLDISKSRLAGVLSPLERAALMEAMLGDVLDVLVNSPHRFGAHRMRSVMRAEGRLLEERFGPVSITMQLVGTHQGLGMRPVSGRFAGVPLPRLLLPSVVAKEASAAGRHLFEVDIGLPMIGRLVAYHGFLDV